MIEDNREVFYIERDLQNSFKSHNQLCKFTHELLNAKSSQVIVDLNNVNFIASNLFSVLGCVFSEFNRIHPGNETIYIRGIKPSIADTVQKNGFNVHLGMEKIPDIHNTVIPYQRFKVDEIDNYERYLTINLFTRKDLPKMSKEASDSIRDSLLELFKNVKDHSTSKYVYTCGQYFPKSYMLYFTIVDIGETISYNVNRYHSEHYMECPTLPLQWAIAVGNSTLNTTTPRGIGLSLIRDFVLLNQGSFYIISGEETYEILRAKERFKKMDYSFPGTIVTVGFNLHDNAVYYMSSDDDNTIHF